MLTSSGNTLPSAMRMMHRIRTRRILRHQKQPLSHVIVAMTPSSGIQAQSQIRELTGSCIVNDHTHNRKNEAGCNSSNSNSNSNNNLPSSRPGLSRSLTSSFGGTVILRGQSCRMMTTDSNSHGNNSGNSKEVKTRLATLRLYRMLQRSCKDLVPADDGTILLQNDILASDWGKYTFHDNGVNDGNKNKNNNDDDDEVDTCTAENQTNELIRLFLLWNGADPAAGFSKLNDWYDELMSGARFHDSANAELGACWTTPNHLRETIRFAFRSSSKMSSHNPTELQGLALRAIQMMQDQHTLWKQSSVSTNSDGLVRVTATSRCLGTVSPVSFAAPSSPLDPKYRFAYRIRVENVSKDTTVQLLGRYWHIAEEHDGAGDEDGSSLEPIEVDAPYTGAVGQLPVLQPGQAFEYVSGTDLATPIGTMMGHFYMATVPSKTRSAKSGDDVVAVSYQGSSSSPSSVSDDTATSRDNNKDTRLFHATVKPFRLQSFEK